MKNKIEYCKKYLDLSDSTLRSYISWIDRLCSFSEKNKSTEITPEDIESFRYSLRDLSPRSHAVAYAAINTIYRKMLWHLMSDEFKSGFERIMAARPKQPHRLPLCDTVVLSEAKILGWLENIENDIYRLCASMTWYLGAKLSETCTIRRVDVQKNKIRFSNRSIPIPDAIGKKTASQKRASGKLKSDWLFPSLQNPKRNVSPSIIQKVLLASKPDTIPIGTGVRAFRASYIIHQMRTGADPNWLAYSLGLRGPGSLIPYMKLDGYFI